MAQYLTFVLAHPWLFVAVAALLVLFIANELHGRATGAPSVTVTEAVRMINDREPLIVDVRSAADYKRGHLRGAVNIPAARIAERASELGRDKERPLLLYCSIGPTAAEAARTLLKLGHTQVFKLSGGINGWLGANLPVTTK